MIIKDSLISDVKRIEVDVHRDNRGHLMEAFNVAQLGKSLGVAFDFVQENEIFSLAGALRGLHFQVGAYAQYKLVRVLKGVIFDVAVDIRKNSLTYGRWVCHIMHSSYRQLLIPPGFAHGFLALDDSIVVYQTDRFLYEPATRILRWDDPVVAIQWPFPPILISEKDQQGSLLADLKE